MAKNYSKSRKRDTNAISNRRLRFSIPLIKSPLRFGLRVYEDRRGFYPEPYTRPARSFSQTLHRLKAVTRPSSLYIRAGLQTPTYTQKLFNTVPIGIGFRKPWKVLICVRRKQRREVMFATKKAGKGGQRTARLTNEYSGVRC